MLRTLVFFGHKIYQRFYPPNGACGKGWDD